MKVTSTETKVTLRRLADRWLPASLARRPKKGFSFPIRDWFQGSLHGWLRDSLLSGTSAVNDYFQREHVERVLNEHRDGSRNHGGRLYSLLMFELWHQNFVTESQSVSEQPVVARKSA